MSEPSSEPSYLETPQGRRIAYHLTGGKGPTVVFLGGFRSDMEGTKAVHLEDWCRKRGQAFLRFDYSGHGQSSEDFLDGAIGDWAEDAEETINALVDGPVMLVGSSMGGWISLILSKRLGDKVCGLVGIAAAPDFTEDSMWAGFSADQKVALVEDGRVELASEYSDDPYVITRRLIEEGRSQLVLRLPLVLKFPARFLQGTEDADVDMAVALRLLDHAEGKDLRLTLVKGADHRFSTPECLGLIERAIDDVLTRGGH
ncbi:alpha/beta hydrolase [Psychromarinibacter halotolerans]|uniref:Alpha/beta hydrolase n=1 Tax=Psychromarinibacter halotolerans TaxID=1775175 RepID=A0ABV7GSW4_9RHOB|nr:alpha/beta hydrolase [Psychromarinibacter halotolerans]MDF0598691.1 alpha/beta hydrolase [Psychromarinibacter halotolerans]